MFPIERAREMSGPTALTETFIDAQIEAAAKSRGSRQVTFNIADYSLGEAEMLSYRAEGYTVTNMGSYWSFAW